MNIGLVFLSAVFVSNIVFVFFLGPYPIWIFTRRLVDPVRIGIAYGVIMAALGTVFGLLYRFALQPLQAGILGTFLLAVLLVVTAVSIERLGIALFPYRAGTVRRIVPLTVTNVGVFVVVMGLAETVSVPFAIVPVAGMAAGLGVTVALLPIAAVRRRMHRFPLPDYIRGEAFLWFAAAVTSLAFLYANRMYEPFVPSLW